MKKLFFYLAFVAATALTACGSKPAETEEAASAAEEQEIVVEEQEEIAPAEEAAPAEVVAEPQKEEAKPTKKVEKKAEQKTMQQVVEQEVKKAEAKEEAKVEVQEDPELEALVKQYEAACNAGDIGAIALGNKINKSGDKLTKAQKIRMEKATEILTEKLNEDDDE